MGASSGRPLLRLFIVLVIELIGFGIAIPVLPFLTKDFGGDAFTVGLLFALMALGQFGMAPVWGGLSDRIGRRGAMAISLGCAAVASLATALAPTLIVLFAARILAGMANGNVSIASAYVTDFTPPSERSRGMAVIGIAFGLGFTLGPAIGAGLATLGHEVPFYVAFGISLVNAGVAAAVLAEPPAQPASVERRPGWAQAMEVLSSPTTQTTCLMFFGFTVATTLMEGAFAFYLLDLFGYGAREVGMVLTGLAVVMALVQGGGVGRLSKRLGDRSMSLWGLGLLAVGLLGVWISHELIWVLGMLALGAVGRALAHPGIMALTSNAAQRGEEGRTMGVLQAMASLGRVFGPALGGVLYEVITPDAPFIAAGLILVVVSIFGGLRLRSLRESDVSEQGPEAEATR